jgi:hypothetical protein
MPQQRRSQSRTKPEESRLDDKWKWPANGREEVALLAPMGSVGAELGVDTGQLSRRFIELDHFKHFHCVDKWDDHAHSENQYTVVNERLSVYPEVSVWRMTAQEWLKTIPDSSFGFIYIDCYAHTGQDGGSVLEAAWPKLQEGGIFSGDDYDRKYWPKTYGAVNVFARRHGYAVNVRDDFCAKAKVRMDRHPTWWWRK